jgi:plasmid stabilization system protein ParE
VRRIQFDQRARAEVREADRFYSAISPALARRFAEALEEAVTIIGRDPMMWPMVAPGLRRHVLKRFPYVILYREEGDTLLILVVAHQSRRAGYGLDRS